MLAIDAGNSRLKFGLFVPSLSSFYRRDGEAVRKIIDAAGNFPSCRRFLAVPVGDAIPWKTLSSWRPEATVIAGSNPSGIEQVLNEWVNSDLPEPLVVSNRETIDIAMDVDFPDKVGLDRLLGAVAANALRPGQSTGDRDRFRNGDDRQLHLARGSLLRRRDHAGIGDVCQSPKPLHRGLAVAAGARFGGRSPGLSGTKHTRCDP